MVTLDRKFFYRLSSLTRQRTLRSGFFTLCFRYFTDFFTVWPFSGTWDHTFEQAMLVGPRTGFFNARSSSPQTWQAMPLAVKKRKNDRPVRTAVSAFSLDGATSPYPFDRDCVSGCAPKSALHANRHPLKNSECLMCESVKTQFV